MRVLVAGAGAIGGFLAARLALAGNPVSVVARGAHLEAMRQTGTIAIETAGGPREVARVEAVDDPRAAPPPDLLIVACKAHQVPELAPALRDAAARAEAIVPCHNGVGWWYFRRHGGVHDGRVLRAVDPGGAIAAWLDPARVLPAFAFKAAEVVAPGLVRHIPTAVDSFPLGELDGADSPRARRLAALLEAAGIKAPVEDVRRLMWRKLLGNIWANPIGALTGATVGASAHHPLGRALARALMAEVAAVAAALGIDVGADFEARLGRADQVGAAKASMLQDRERGRRMEHDAILGALVEIAGLVGVAVPRSEALYACLALLERTALTSGADPLH